MKGIIFALLGGAFITLQGIANTRISEDIGTWQAATITQFTGFIMAMLILLVVRDVNWKGFKQVKPLYFIGGAFGAMVIYSNVVSIQNIGVTLSISAILIAQLIMTFIIDSNGWFGLEKQKMKLPQFVGIGMMIVGVVILSS
jgi:bacterial/archaeal transporter family-2 protein